MAKRNKQQKNKQLHDEFVKTNLSDKTMAQDFMRQFLPSELINKLDLKGLELDTNSYITTELAKYYSDLLWLCPYNKNTIRIALLLEHKSSLVAYPHLQLLRYMLEIWEKNQKEAQPFLPIVPIIFYHGDSKWHVRPMIDYFKGIESELYQYIPQFNYELVDVSQYSDETILSFKIGLLKNVLLALSHSRDQKYLRQNFGFLFIEADEYIQTPKGVDFIKTMFVYLLKNTEFSDEDIENMLNQIPSPLNNIAMSTYDRLIYKGLREGIEKGIENEKIEVIKNARLNGLDIETISKIVKLPTLKIRQILDDSGIE